MAYYLMLVSYSPETVKSLLKNPQNRMEKVRPVIEKLGGKIENFWFSFGEYDIVGICQMPDNISAVAFSMAVGAGGSVKAFKTIPLLSIEDGVEAMKKAGESGYKPPE